MVHELQFLLGHLDAHFLGLVPFPHFFSIVADNDTKSNEECPLQEYDKLVEIALTLEFLPSLPKSKWFFDLCLDYD